MKAPRQPHTAKVRAVGLHHFKKDKNNVIPQIQTRAHAQEGRCILDETLREMRDGNVFDAMENFRIRSRALRATLPADEWQHFARQEFRFHPLLEALHESPFARRSYEK